MQQRMRVDFVFFFSSRRRHTRYIGDWSSDVCSSDLSRQYTATEPSSSSTRSESKLFRTDQSIPLPTIAATSFADSTTESRSEERRVGKECRSRWATVH